VTSPDQLAVSGILQNGAVVSFQIRGGMTRGTEFLFEIHGTEGDLVLASTTGGSMQRQELSLHGTQGKGTKLAELPIPAKYRYVPENTPANSPYNVAQLYAQLANTIADPSRQVRSRRPDLAKQTTMNPPTRAVSLAFSQIGSATVVRQQFFGIICVG
jgi:predicted dehydrogenase